MQLYNRLLSKLTTASEVRGETEHRTRVCTAAHENSSTVSTTQFADAVEFGKGSIKGSALITALFIVALIAALTTAATLRMQRTIYYTHTNMEHARLYAASQLVTFWAMQTLNQKTRQEDDHHIRFPKHMAKLYPNILITGDLVNLTRWEKDHGKDEHIFLPDAFKILRLTNSTGATHQDYLCVTTTMTIDKNTLTTYTLIRHTARQNQASLTQIIGVLTA